MTDKFDQTLDEWLETSWRIVVVGAVFERSNVCRNSFHIFGAQTLVQRILNVHWMGHKKFTNRLSHDVSNWFIVVIGLVIIKLHQSLDVSLKAFWFVDDNLFDGAQEHVLLLTRRSRNQLKNFIQKERSISNRNSTQRNCCS
jgi:hypothetical protein